MVQARETVRQTLGPEVMIDAAAVASNFERMVRIADPTGIPLDERMANLSQPERETLQLERFAAAKQSA